MRIHFHKLYRDRFKSELKRIWREIEQGISNANLSGVAATNVESYDEAITRDAPAHSTNP